MKKQVVELTQEIQSLSTEKANNQYEIQRVVNQRQAEMSKIQGLEREKKILEVNP